MPTEENNTEQVTATAETQSTAGSLLEKANEQSTLGLKKTLTYSEIPKKTEPPVEEE